MLRSLLSSSFANRSREHGQATVIFAAGLVVFLLFVGLSVDVGRAMWAKNQMQAAIDASALAAAQSMPNGTSEASLKATEYWDANNDFITSNASNVNFNVTFPSGNRAVQVEADAEVDTWFLKLGGLDHFHIEVDGTAAASVVDIAIVMDISGSMCFQSNPPIEGNVAHGYSFPGYVIGPGRAVLAGGAARPQLKLGVIVPAGGPSTGVQIQLNDVRAFTNTNSGQNDTNYGDDWASGTPYWSRDPDGGGHARPGIIMIDDEVMQITAVNAATNTITVNRGLLRKDTNVVTPKQLHQNQAVVQRLHDSNGSSMGYCYMAGSNTPNATTNGPHQPFDEAVNVTQYFITKFNPAYDKIGFAHYSATGAIDHSITNNFSAVSATLDGDPDMFYPNNGTNTAHGIAKGKFILQGGGTRLNSIKILVLITDGVPNTHCSNSSAYTNDATSCTTASTTTPTSCPATNTSTTQAVAQAAAAKAAGFTVHTIGLGTAILPCVLQDMATAGGGNYYFAPTTAQLDDAFNAIAAMTHIELTN